MSAMASQITGVSIVYLTVSSGADHRKLALLALCARNSLVTGEFPAQRASNAENVYIWCRHHEFFLIENEDSLIPRSQYHGCWCPSDGRSSPRIFQSQHQKVFFSTLLQIICICICIVNDLHLIVVFGLYSHIHSISNKAFLSYLLFSFRIQLTWPAPRWLDPVVQLRPPRWRWWLRDCPQCHPKVWARVRWVTLQTSSSGQSCFHPWAFTSTRRWVYCEFYRWQMDTYLFTPWHNWD